MLYIFCIFAGLLIHFSSRSLISGTRFLKYVRQEMAKPPSSFTPFATLIFPCKGIDTDLGIHIRNALDQDYPNYETIFVVDSITDPSVDLINSALTGRKDARLIVAGSNGNSEINSSMKIKSLLAAIDAADRGSEAFVFFDSDAMHGRDCLARLVGALENKKAGASTGYRWFFDKKGGIASNAASSWNASIASALGQNTSSNFCWGGAMAVTRQNFEALEVRKFWSGSISDDLGMTRAVRNGGLGIVFVPQALAVSKGEFTLASLIEFTTRQIKVTRANMPGLWAISFAGSMMFCILMTSAILMMIFSEWPSISAAVAAFTFFSVSAFSIAKAYVRLRAVSMILAPRGIEARLKTFAELTMWFPAQFIFAYNCIAALLSRKIVWRGVRYMLKSSNETVIIRD